MPEEDLLGELLAVIGRGDPLDVLQDDRREAPVVLELIGAVMDADAGAFADEFVVSAFVDVLESAPAGDVVHQDAIEIGTAKLDIPDELLQAVAPRYPEAASARIGIGVHNGDVTARGVGRDRGCLVLD